MQNVRVLVVGLGNMGLSHARAYKSIEGFEIVGLCSRDIGQRSTWILILISMAQLAFFRLMGTPRSAATSAMVWPVSARTGSSLVRFASRRTATSQYAGLSSIP